MMKKLDHIKQFNLKVETGKKVDFIKDVFTTLESTQTYIFINSINYAKNIQKKLEEAKLGSEILHSKMDKAKRDEVMEKFRSTEINVLVTTNIIARGIDVPEA